MKKEIVLFLAVAAAVALFVAFRLSGLEDFPVIGAALALYHCKHFCAVVVGLVSKFAEV